LQLIHNAGRGGDEVEVKFASQPFLNDLQVEQPQEAAAVMGSVRYGGELGGVGGWVGESGHPAARWCRGRLSMSGSGLLVRNGGGGGEGCN
jgi:hypothetical protein